MSQNQRQSGAANTRFCLGRKCGDLVCARGKTQTRADFCTRKSQEKAEYEEIQLGNLNENREGAFQRIC